MKVWELSISDINFSPYYFPEEKDEKLFAENYLSEGKSLKEKWEPLVLLKKITMY